MALQVRMSVPPIPAAIEAVAEGLVGLNCVLFAIARRKGVNIPDLPESGIVYRREARGREFWQAGLDALGLSTTRAGDCEDLSAYRAAWLRVFEGEAARVKIIRTKRGSFHAVVERADGSIEDPSREMVILEYQRTGYSPEVK
jgi:hypothetical protein